MPPARSRAVQEDSKQEHSNPRSTLNGAPTTKNGRKTGAMVASGAGVSKTGVTSQPSALSASTAQSFEPGLNWNNETVPQLHKYRTAYDLDAAPSFESSLNQAVLTNPGIGRQSPTMARRKQTRKSSKDQLAIAVRKHFNGLAVNETDVVVDFLYKTKTQELESSLSATETEIKVLYIIISHFIYPVAVKKGMMLRILAFGIAGKDPLHSTRNLQATKDPYNALGVGKSASTSEIKKAYYGLAKKYHPDTNKEPKAKERFGDAQSAYEILSDPQKKAAYDQYGAAAFDQGFDPSAGQGGGGGGGSPFGAGGPFSGFQDASSGFRAGGAEFNFEDLFSAFGGGGRRGRGGQRSSPFQEEILVGENIDVQTNISFIDAAKGTTKEIFVTPLVECKPCSGSGMRKGFKRQECGKCNGTGTRVHFVQAGFQMASTCNACGGQGVTIPKGSECGTCSGNGVNRERKTVSVDIPGGVEDGMRLRVKSEGDAPPLGQAANPNARSQRGDLYVFIRVATDSKFSRSGADILYTASIPITTAVLGGEIVVPTLEGEVRVKVNTGTGTGDRATLGGMGMKKLGSRRAGNGDLRVEFKVQMPKYLSVNQRAIMEMMASDLGDKSAKRVMNFDAKESKSDDKKADVDASHENEGFLKSAWHRMTGQHDQKPASSELNRKQESADNPKDKTPPSEDEPKKASGSA
ncbi:MAG: hypothetical protein M1828_000998 [Chrysothrix sp. TS-e1954]|nr:MAG: hypothetical protein M1828_000998 [Chrysothrix sp. TS-e1954]